MAYVVNYSYVLCKFKSEMVYCVLGKVKFVTDTKIGLLKVEKWSELVIKVILIYLKLCSIWMNGVDRVC